MTQKELLYLEDAIGHEKNIVKLCEGFLNNIESDELKEFMSREISNHNQLCDNLTNFLGGKANE